MVVLIILHLNKWFLWHAWDQCDLFTANDVAVGSELHKGIYHAGILEKGLQATSSGT